MLAPIVQQIKAAFQSAGVNDATFSVRGSLATGWSFDKTLKQDGRPWDPDKFDVDAFVKSSQLAQLIPGNPTSSGNFISLSQLDRAEGFRSGEVNNAAAQEMKTRVAQAANALAAAFAACLKPGEFAFKVFSSSASVSGLPL